MAKNSHAAGQYCSEGQHVWFPRCEGDGGMLQCAKCPEVQAAHTAAAASPRSVSVHDPRCEGIGLVVVSGVGWSCPTCQQQDLALDTREEAIHWIIASQLGRRNLTPEQKSYLRGKRYTLEKKVSHRPTEKGVENQHLSGKTEARLAKEYTVSPSTIRADGDFATAVDTLEAQVRQEVAVALRQAGHSERAIAGALGVSKTTIHNDIDALVTTDQLQARHPVSLAWHGKVGQKFPKIL